MPHERTLIFCRGVQSARAVQHALSRDGVQAGGCHGAMPERRRQSDLESFLSTPPQLPYLVCTDINARGVDFPDVNHVINFDFPASSALCARIARNANPRLTRHPPRRPERRACRARCAHPVERCARAVRLIPTLGHHAPPPPP